MAKPLVRIFVEPKVRLFKLSPLYARPGWYGVVDACRPIGPFARIEQVVEIADEVLTRRGAR